MAGYICKIVFENTHPPVWRRIIIPDRITFQELHEIIQVLFSWENDHLHEFEVPGDNFLEDSGGAWNEDSTRTAFDSAKVEQKLNCMMLSSHEELQEVKLLKESLYEMAKNLKKLFEVNTEILQSQIAAIRQDLYENSDPMRLKIEAWRKADQKGLESLSIKTPEKSQNMLLMDLGEKEAG